MHNICLSPGTSSIIPQEIHETTSQQHLPSSLPAALEIVVAAIHLEKRERHCCMLREPTVVSQNYVGRLKFIVVFMGTLLLHKEMDKCWNTHSGKTNHLGQNHGGMIVAFIPCHSDPLLYLRNLRHRNQRSWKAFEHYTSWYCGWGIPNGYPGEVEKSFPIMCIWVTEKLWYMAKGHP